MIRVSVLIPAYNAEYSLETAVFSVLGQTERSLELLIIDDASSDGTLAVARSLQARDPRIRVIAMESNGGKVLAMNRAMAEAQGEWIAVLDADDWYAPERLAVMLNAAERSGLDLVADDWISVDAGARVYLRSPLPRLTSDTILDLDLYLKGSRPTAKADYGMLKPIIRRSFVETHGIWYHPKARRGQDFYFLLSYFLAGGKALLLKDPYYYYVEPYGAISRTWAQVGRERYRFEGMIQINNEYVERYGSALSRPQLRHLRQRSRGWRDLIAYHKLRELVLERRMGAALQLLVHTSPGFWAVFIRHGWTWLRTRLFGPSQQVLGKARNGGTLGNA